MEKLASFLAASEGNQASDGLETELSSLGGQGGPFDIALVGNITACSLSFVKKRI